jgi:PAS domain-containing protein
VPTTEEALKLPKFELPLRIVFLYLLFGGVWILLSDQLLFVLVPHEAVVTTYQTLKGWFFVLVSGLFLYILLRMDIAGRRRAEQKVAWLASFPERNPNPVVEIDSTGAILYMNLAAQNRFPDLREQGFKHPWLAGLESAIDRFQREGKSELQREVQIDESWFSQPIYRRNSRPSE